MKRHYIESERADLFDVNMMIVMRVMTKGNVTETALKTAFDKAVNSHRILCSKIVLGEDGKAYYERQDVHKNQIICSNLSLREEINKQERIRFKLEEGEFLRCFYNGEDNGRTFTFMMHHLGGDGKSLCYFIESFFLALEGEELKERDIVLLTKDTMPKESALTFMPQKLADICNRKYKKVGKIFGIKEMEASFQTYWKHRKSITSYKEVQPAELDQELKECKKEGIGYTSYYISKILEGTVGKQKVGLAVDGRLDGNKSMSNQATGISINYTYNAKLSVLQNAKRIDKLIKSKLLDVRKKYLVLQFMGSLMGPLVDGINLEFTGIFHSKVTQKLAKSFGYGENQPDYSISNLTILDIKTDYGKIKITDFWFIPPIVSYGKNLYGMVTVNGKLNIVHRVMQEVKEEI